MPILAWSLQGFPVMPKLSMILDPPDPKMSPRQMANRDRLLVLGAVLIVAAIVTGAVKLAQYRREAGLVRSAEARLRAIPALKDTHLKPVAGKAVGDRSSDIVDASGRVLGTAALRPTGDLYVGFMSPGLHYKPITDQQLQSYLFSGEVLDTDATRFADHAVGALLVLWPNLGEQAVHFEKVEAVTAAASKATVDVGISVAGGGKVGVSVEMDLVRRHLLSIDLRKR
jgi:hypothetical protein